MSPARGGFGDGAAHAGHAGHSQGITLSYFSANGHVLVRAQVFIDDLMTAALQHCPYSRQPGTIENSAY
jgi:hypothetical protein